MADSKLIDRNVAANSANGGQVDPADVTMADVGTGTSPKSVGWRNIKNFVAIISLLGVFFTTEQMLRFSVLTTLERRFSFTTSHNGIIVSAYDMGHVVLLVILSIYGGRVHRPRMCALGGYLSGVAGFLWAVPHFIFGSGIADTIDPTTPQITNHSSATGGLGLPPHTLCQVDPSSNISLRGTGCLEATLAANMTSTGNDPNSVETTVSFIIFFISQCLLGAGLAPFLTVAITYLDDNTDPATSALGVSIFLSVGSIGLVFGFLLGAAMTGVFVTLSATHLTPADPEWVGAWWLGSLCISLVVCLVSTPLLFFPRSLTPTPTTRKRQESVRSDNSQDTRAEKMRPMLQRRVSVITDITELKEMPQRTRSLATNPVYICTTLAMCAITYLSAALFPFLPKYLETQFNIEPTVANIITSIVTALAVATGTFTGGYIASARELSPLGSSKLVLVGVTIGVSAFTTAIFLGCGNPSIIGMPGDSQTSGALVGSCINNCSCVETSFMPVCGEDKHTYFSACHAGCTSVSLDLTTFSNCSCLSPDGAWSQAIAGICDSGCITLVPYAILVFITTFTICMGTSPIVAILIRSVAAEQKSIALGINNVLTSVLAAIPGPMLYGRMIDSACAVTDTSCDGQSACVHYDNDRFRFLLHGVTEIFLVLTAVCMIIAFFCLRGKDDKPATEENAKTADNDKEPEAEPMVQAEQRV